MSTSLGLWRLYRSSPFPKIQILAGVSPEERLESLSAMHDCDIFVVAGGLGTLEEAIKALAATATPCVYVLGPDEIRGREFSTAAAEARTLAKGTCVHVLQRDGVVLDGVRFLGATLWSSFDNWRPELVAECTARPEPFDGVATEVWWQDEVNRREAEELCRCVGQLVPHQSEIRAAVALHPAVAYVEHRRTLGWLEEELESEFDGPTVVVSSSAPVRSALDAIKSYRAEDVVSVDWPAREHKRYSARLHALTNDGRGLLSRHRANIDLWVHGGVSANSDIVEEGVRVVCRSGLRVAETDEPLVVEILNRQFAKLRKAKREKASGNRALKESEPVWHPAAIDLELGFLEPLMVSTQPVAAELAMHESAIRNVLPHLMAKSSVHRACVRRVIHEELCSVDQLSRTVDDLDEQLVALHRLQFRKEYAKDSPNGYPSEMGDGYQFDYFARVDSIAQRLGFIRKLPQRATVLFSRWCDLALSVARTLDDQGVSASIVRLPYEALRRAEGSQWLTVVVADKSIDFRALRKSLVEAHSSRDHSDTEIRVLDASEVDCSRYVLLGSNELREVVENLVVAADRIL